jgi:hypothetical protein
MKGALGSATPSGCHLEKRMGFLNFQKQCWLLPADGIVKFNWPLSFWLIQLSGSTSARYHSFYYVKGKGKQYCYCIFLLFLR